MKFLSYFIIIINAIPMIFILAGMWKVKNDLTLKVKGIYEAITLKKPILAYDGIPEAWMTAWTAALAFWIIRLWSNYQFFYVMNIEFSEKGIEIPCKFYSSTLLISFLLFFITGMVTSISKGNKMKRFAIESFIWKRKNA